ncbi:MAG: hypothetical protein AAFX87_12145, partial [Bacteroidota bacterium]
ILSSLIIMKVEEVNTNRIDHFFKLDRLYQRLQVYVEDIRIADSEEVWVFKEVNNQEIKNDQFLIPVENIESPIFKESGHTERCLFKGKGVLLDLQLSYPYRIQVSHIATAYRMKYFNSGISTEMVAFQPEKVSFRLDPLND